MNNKKNSTKICVHCGETISEKATACPVCGSDEQTGWSEKTYLDGIGLPNDIDYDELAQEEFGQQYSPRKTKRWWLSWKTLIAAVIVTAFLLGYMRFMS